MPYLELIESDKLQVFYNLTNAAGKNAPNQKDDVDLVQYLLLKVYSRSPIQASDPRVCTWSRPKGNLGVDGICGPVTNNWILKFQIDYAMASHHLQMDGRVDRARKGGPEGGIMSLITETVYTICALNRIMMLNYPDEYEFLINLNSVSLPQLRAMSMTAVAA